MDYPRCAICPNRPAAESLQAQTDEQVASGSGVSPQPGCHVAEIREMADRARFALRFPSDCVQWLDPSVVAQFVTLTDADFYDPFPH